MKKYSFYNRIFYAGDNIVLYNSASDGILMLLPEIEDLLQTHEENPEGLIDFHEELYQSMLDKQMIVDKDADEYEQVIAQWRQNDTDEKTFSITINPTMDCNLRCWYCYEEHTKGSKMTPDLIESVKNLLQKRATETPLEQLHLSFFGGEPLLYFDDTVLPILEQAKELCTAHNIALGVSFTTNGVLLTPDRINVLKRFHTAQNPISFQITLDGNARMHNMVRKTASGDATYGTIVSNIKGALSMGFHINLRLNYTNRTAATFVDIIKDFEDFTTEQKALLVIDFKKVWQDAPSEDSEKKIEETRSWMEKEGFTVACPTECSNSRCYADSENCVVINYDGGLYKCTARKFTSNNAEGMLSDKGDLAWNEKYSHRMSVKYGNTTCHQCDIFPICHGGCSQDKVEAAMTDGCIRRYDEEKRESILAGRVKNLLKSLAQK